MITKIGTPASQRITSRSMVVPLCDGRTPTVESEAGRYRRIAVLAATHGRPPSSTQRDDQPSGRYEAGKDGGSAGLVGGCPRSVYRLVDAPFGVLRRESCALAHELSEPRAVL